jgi:hypothetical protein
VIQIRGAALALLGAILLAGAPALAADKPSTLDPDAHPLLKLMPWLPKSARGDDHAEAPATPAAPAPTAKAVPAPAHHTDLAQAAPARPVPPPAAHAPAEEPRATSLDPQAHPLLKLMPWLPKAARHPGDAAAQTGG